MTSPLILYATETGTAQDIADQIARRCRRISISCRLQNVEKYPAPQLISESLVIFVISTTGSGKEPRTLKSLLDMLLRSDLPTDLFDELHCCVFGLGDSSYEKFCWPAKILSRRLKDLGATEVVERGEGDEQHHLGIEGGLDSWWNTLQPILLQFYPLPPGHEIARPDTVPTARVRLDFQSEASSISTVRFPENFHDAVLSCNKRITAEDWFQDVRHFEFSFEDDIQYSPGDVAVIHPIADSKEVESFLEEIGWGNWLDTPFTITQCHSDQSLPDLLPEASTLRILFERYLDFNAVPRRPFFEYLGYFTQDELERERLSEFLAPEGADELYNYCFKVKRTIREVLAEFRGVRIPQEYVFDVFPPLRPREFSIASSVQVHPKKIHLCVAVVRYRTRLKVPRLGVCTTYLASLKPGDSLRIGIKGGFITLPQDSATPVICISPGTGIAPARALIQERLALEMRDNTLYFGCRSAEKDQHYKEEWVEYVKTKSLDYRVTCSRDGAEGTARVYVQDLIRGDAERIWALLEDKAVVLISGSSNKMPAAVKAALMFAIEKCGSMTVEAAGTFLQAMERDGRLVEDCWS